MTAKNPQKQGRILGGGGEKYFSDWPEYIPLQFQELPVPGIRATEPRARVLSFKSTQCCLLLVHRLNIYRSSRPPCVCVYCLRFSAAAWQSTQSQCWLAVPVRVNACRRAHEYGAECAPVQCYSVPFFCTHLVKHEFIFKRKCIHQILAIFVPTTFWNISKQHLTFYYLRIARLITKK